MKVLDILGEVLWLLAETKWVITIAAWTIIKKLSKTRTTVFIDTVQ